MVKNKFYYTQFPVVDNHGKKIGKVARPIIEIVINFRHGKMVGPIEALIDSGADHNLFPAEIASALGINLKKGKKFSTFGISGDEIVVYRHYGIKIFVNGSSFETSIDCSDKYHEIVLLGQQGFFDKLKKITFDRVNEEFIVEI